MAIAMRNHCQYCDDVVHAKGMCGRHYRRYLRHDDPHVVKGGYEVDAHEALSALIAYQKRVGKMPTQQELADALGIARSTALRRLLDLEWLGYIEREPHVKRGIRLTDDAREMEAHNE